ncbi:MAG: alpha/beta hydrolase [Candidatus Angelobacter sp. Gp1-AA117]|nr:MAG: alpha/beta hydrolase [Candidatus Angelobacter sp. Gp1-AA117]
MFPDKADTNHSAAAVQHSKEDVQADAIARLTRAVLSVRPLIDVLAHPVCVAPFPQGGESSADDEIALEDLLNRIAGHCGAPEFAVLDDVTVFERIVSNRLQDCVPADFQQVSQSPEVNPIIQATVSRSFEHRFHCTDVPSFDGVALKTYAAGNPSRAAVIMITACGMPAKLAEAWMDFLAKDHFVITWETRGLFGKLAHVDSASWDTGAQAKDLFAVMDHYGIKIGHVMGLCGGAIVALIAAHNSPERISSLSLWYGDFELGPAVPKTMYQQNLKDIMLMSGAGRTEAASTHELFCGAMIKNMRADLAHLIIYPYATPELLFRYGKLNGSIMSSNVEPLLAGISHRTLVVTSQDDSTAHPEGSRRVASLLPNSTLHVEAHGDHLSFYEATSGLTEVAARFITSS